MVLVGLMGSGKTTVGRLVAERTGRTLIDADEAIRELTGKSVRELWERGGEAAYRRLESRVVIDCLAGEDRDLVIAAPAGAVLDPAVRAALGRPGVLVVWLRADPDVLASRVHPGDHRPLIGEHPGEVLQHMAAERASTYRKVSDVVVDVGALDPEEAASKVNSAIDREGREGAR